MTGFVKHFIQDNIESIELEKYVELMSIWKQEANRIPGFYEDEFFDEFLSVLSVAYPDAFEKSQAIREQLMQAETFQRIKTQKINYNKGVIFTAEGTIMHIVTKLGITDEQLVDFCDDAARILDLIVLNRGEYKNT